MLNYDKVNDVLHDVAHFIIDMPNNWWSKEIYNKYPDGLIDDEDLPHLFIAGGALVNPLIGDNYIKDYDLYFDDENIANKYRDRFDDLMNTCLYFIKNVFSYQLTVDNEFLLSFNLDHSRPPKYLMESFDFEHCKVYAYLFDQNSNIPSNYKSHIYLSETTRRALENKQLIYTNSKMPILALNRARKFNSRGFSLDKIQFDRILQDCLLQVTQDDIDHFFTMVNS